MVHHAEPDELVALYFTLLSFCSGVVCRGLIVLLRGEWHDSFLRDFCGSGETEAVTFNLVMLTEFWDCKLSPIMC